jgi:transposase
MALVTVNDDDDTEDARSKPRWSAGKKLDVVLRLLRGEKLDALSRELGVEAHRIAAWRDDFLSGGKEALKGRRGPLTEDDRQLREAERKIGELTMEVEVWRRAAEKGVLRCRRRSDRDSRGDHVPGGHGVSHPPRPPLDHLPPSGQGRRTMSPRPQDRHQRRAAAASHSPGARELPVLR